MFNNITPVVKNLLLINIVAFIATLYLPSVLGNSQFDLNNYLGLHYWDATDFNTGQLVSYMFLRGGYGHLFFNMFALFMFGSLLERMWGGQKFLIFYLFTGVGAGLMQELVWTLEFNGLFSALDTAIDTGSADALQGYTSKLGQYLNFSSLSHFSSGDFFQMKNMLANALVTIGASGAVFGLLLAFGWYFPEEKVYLMFIPIGIKAKYFVIIYGVVELFLGVSQFSGDSVAHFAHLGGMLFALLILMYWKRK